MVAVGTTLSAEITTFAAAYTNVILLPGPSFVVVCEAGLSATRREASLVAIGVACGAGALASTILQIAPMLQTTPVLMSVGRICCALILLAMGFRILCRSLRQARKSVQPGPSHIAQTRFMTGFIAAVTNPVSFASFTAAALAVRTQHGDCVIVAVVIFLMALGWFSTLALLFSRPFLTAHYGRAARTLGSVMGCVLMAKAVSFLVLAL